MKILFIAPFPPPWTGNSLPVKTLYDELIAEHDIKIINLSKKSYNAGVDSIGRIIEILAILWKVWRVHKKYDTIYMSNAESYSGNLRDLLIYLICRKRLGSLMIHMLGGAGMKTMLDKGGRRAWLNKRYVSKLKGVIVEGQAQKDTFSQLIDTDRVFIIPNFAQSFLFLDESKIQEKFNRGKEENCVRLLFLSNMLPGKGHQELFEAYKALSKETQAKIRLDFAGQLVETDWQDKFLEEVATLENVEYHGLVDAERKTELFHASHVFCLPTYYPYEGQPFTIIEAYASGNAVITTDHSGIGHIFQGQVHGIEAIKKSVDNLEGILEGLPDSIDQLQEYGKANRIVAEKKYRQEVYVEKMKSALLATI